MTKAWVFWQSPGEKVVHLWTPVLEWGVGSRILLLTGPLLLLHILTSCNTHLFLRRVLPAVVVTVIFGVLSAIALSFMPLESRPFIYFQF